MPQKRKWKVTDVDGREYFIAELVEMFGKTRDAFYKIFKYKNIRTIERLEEYFANPSAYNRKYGTGSAHRHEYVKRLTEGKPDDRHSHCKINHAPCHHYSECLMSWACGRPSPRFNKAGCYIKSTEESTAWRRRTSPQHVLSETRPHCGD
jgi:hypothetical protein